MPKCCKEFDVIGELLPGTDLGVVYGQCRECGAVASTDPQFTTGWTLRPEGLPGPMVCKARQYSDQMQCGLCGLAWDVNDPEPPACRPITQSTWEQQDKKRGREVLARLRGMFL